MTPFESSRVPRGEGSYTLAVRSRTKDLQPQQAGPCRSGSIAPTRPSCPPARLWPGPGPQACSTGTAGTNLVTTGPPSPLPPILEGPVQVRGVLRSAGVATSTVGLCGSTVRGKQREKSESDLLSAPGSLLQASRAALRISHPLLVASPSPSGAGSSAPSGSSTAESTCRRAASRDSAGLRADPGPLAPGKEQEAQQRPRAPQLEDTRNQKEEEGKRRWV